MRPETLNIHQFIREKEKQEKRRLALLIAEVCVWLFMGGMILSRLNDLRKTEIVWTEPVTHYAYTFFYPEDSDFSQVLSLDSLRDMLDTLVEVKAKDEPNLSSHLSEVLTEWDIPLTKTDSEPDGIKASKSAKKKARQEKKIEKRIEQLSPEQARMSLFGAQLPAFPGGNTALNQFIQRELRYPIAASEESVEGKVLLRLWVEADGKITDVSIVEGLGYGCDEEALRLGNRMPRWKPGERQGRKTAMAAYIPVVFSL
ncbi:MAG: energy transducer TonB [Bacteroidia bacterium]